MSLNPKDYPDDETYEKALRETAERRLLSTEPGDTVVEYLGYHRNGRWVITTGPLKTVFQDSTGGDAGFNAAQVIGKLQRNIEALRGALRQIVQQDPGSIQAKMAKEALREKAEI